MNTKSPSPVLDTALTGIPKLFRARLIKSYLDLKKNALESRHDAAGVAVGKFCEICLRLLQNKLLGTYTAFGTHIPNFPDECRRLIASPASSGTESERLILPRALVFLYTMRNKRDLGHVGGDVDANSIDIAAMTRTADWIVCELIRVYHGLSLEEAQDIVDGLAVRQLPSIWEIAGKKRVLTDGLAAKDEALLLLYSCADSSVFIGDLCAWVEYSNPGVFKSKVIGPLHKARLLEFDRETESITLSPKGAAYVEDHLISSSEAGHGG
jgi:hypothetical protein